jgi:uncharacterized protein
MPRVSLEALCLECGLCCNGTLFTHVALTPEESARLGLEVIRQPCSFLGAGCKCTVYASRPKGCARFVCMLGRALEDGEVKHDEAVALVRQAQVMRGSLDALLPGPGAAIPKARRYEADGPDSEVAVKVRDARRALEAFTRTHFLGRHAK